MRKSFLLFLGLICLMVSACALPHRRFSPNPANPVYTVAVLPMYNATNDVDGPRVVREEFLKRVKDMHYSVIPLKESDTILMDQMGITLGSQLEMTNAKQLGEVLGVDAVVFGYLLNFDTITTGVYNVKKVRAGFKLVDTKTGAVVWSKGGGIKSALAGGNVGVGVTALKEIMDAREGIEPYKSIKGIDEIQGFKDWRILYAGEESVGKAAALSLGEKLVTKALGIPLILETNNLLNDVTKGFPVGPGEPRQPKQAKDK